MNKFGEESQLPHLNIAEGDAGVLVGLPLAVLVLTGTLGWDVIALVGTVAAAGFAWGVVYVTPEHISAWTWLTNRLRYLWRPSVTIGALGDVPSSPRGTVAGTRRGIEWGVGDWRPLSLPPDETTEDLTNIERAWPEAGAIERSDGAMEAFLELEPGNMDFAMSNDWQAVVDTAAEFANTKLSSPLKFHVTTRSFPVDDLVGQLEDRLTDPDVQENPRFRALLEDYREKRPREMRDRGAQQLRFFLGVEVHQLEAYNRAHVEPTPAEKLTDLPVIGVLFNPLVTRKEDLSEAERRAKMFTLLEDRRTTVETELAQQIDDWTVRQLSTVELFTLVSEFWNGEGDLDAPEPDRFIREQPVLGRQPRSDADSDPTTDGQSDSDHGGSDDGPDGHVGPSADAPMTSLFALASVGALGQQRREFIMDSLALPDVPDTGLGQTIQAVGSSLPPPISPDGIMLYGAGGTVLLVGLGKLVAWHRNRQGSTWDVPNDIDDPDDPGDPDDADDAEHMPGQSLLDDPGEQHQAVIAPPPIEWKPRAARVGDQWTSTLYIADYPDYPKDGYLSELFTRTDVEFDLTVHLRPRNQDRARSELKEAADSLHVDAELDQSVRGVYLQERAEEATATYKAVENGTRVFSQAMFVTVRADDRETLQEARATLVRELRQGPANLTPKPAGRQRCGLQATAPIGTNTFGRDAESIVLGDGVGALLGSAHNPMILESGGVEVGIHRETKSPVVVDPFARKNYAMFMVGDPGGGKSFAAKQVFIRSMEQSPDRLGVIIEPMRNWYGVATALGARRIPVAGDIGLNPLEIKPTPESVLANLAADENPLTERKDTALGLLQNFFAIRGVDLGDRLPTLELGLDEVYPRAGITTNPATHDNESPTLRDLRGIFVEMADDPEAFVRTADAVGTSPAGAAGEDAPDEPSPVDQSVDTSNSSADSHPATAEPAAPGDPVSAGRADADDRTTFDDSDVPTGLDLATLQADAEWLAHQLRPFEANGRFANLGRATEFDFRDERLVYLDFGHQSGQVSNRTILQMQALISLMYERVKETPKKTVMVIDESRYLMRHAENLQFLEMVFRHHRHHDLSPRLITQTVDEFFQHDEAKIILEQCAIKQFHQMDTMDDKWANKFNLTPPQQSFVQDAIAGESGAGLSQALLGVDGEWLGIEVRATSNEMAVIDFDPAEEDVSDLPHVETPTAEGANDERVSWPGEWFRSDEPVEETHADDD